MKQPQLEMVILRPEDTGGFEMPFERKVIGIPNPHVPESHENPLRAEIETLIWKNPENKDKPGEKVQYIVMGGMNANFTESYLVGAMLTNHADTIVGIAHPDAPQSKIIPHDSPFNDERSFANSGYTVLRTIENLYEEGVLDRNSPLTVVGFSTGGAVLTETTAQDIAETSAKKHGRFIHKAVLLSPGGMLDIGEKEIAQGAVATGPQYWQEFVDTQRNRLMSLLKNPKKLAEALSNSAAPGNIFEDVAHAVSIWGRFIKNLKNMRDWPKDPEWKAINRNHKVFEIVDNLLRVPHVQFIDELLAHFHRMWIDQPGWPHFSPETPAFNRNKENVGYDVTREARKTIYNTPMVVFFGENDKAISPKKFLQSNDEPNEENIMKRIKESFPNNPNNVHVILGKESRSHHLATRASINILELYILRYLYPQKMAEIKPNPPPSNHPPTTSLNQ